MDSGIILCYVVGAIFAYFGIATLVQKLHDKRVCVKEITAVVVDYDVKRDSGGKNGIPHEHYFPIYQFDAEGKRIRKHGNVGYGAKIYPLGTEMTLLYEPGNPDNFIVPSNDKSPYAVSIIIALMGLGVIAVSVVRQLGILVI